MNTSIRATAPASVGNVSCGFDVLGFALREPRDKVKLIRNRSGRIRLCEVHGPYADQVPPGAELNTCGIAARQFLRQISPSSGLDIVLEKNLPVKSGLGSSAASAAATLRGLNSLFGEKVSEGELLRFGLMAEKTVSGTAHGDNLAPSLFGGFVLITGPRPFDYVKLPFPPDLVYVVVHPRIEIQTRKARRILPRRIPLRQAVTQWGYVGGLVSGLLLADYALIGRCLRDVVAEPRRRRMIPGFHRIRERIAAGDALGGGISGSGPSVFALCRGLAVADSVREDIAGVFTELGIESQGFTGSIADTGTRILGKDGHEI